MNKIAMMRFISVNKLARIACYCLSAGCVAIPITTSAADDGETFTTAPVSQRFYTFTPGKLTGKEFFLEDIEKKGKILCREFSFRYELDYKKPAETVSVRLSLRGGYSSFNILGHKDFQLDASANVTTGWVPQSSGNFLVDVEKFKDHSPQWTSASTKLIRVLLIKKYGDQTVNAYDVALCLDRVNHGEQKTINFNTIPFTDDNGKKEIRLVPSVPLLDGVYFAYSLADNIDTDIYGFLFAVGTPASGLAALPTAPEQSAIPANGFSLVDAKIAQDNLDYAFLSQAVYDAPFYKPVGKWKMLDTEFNCPVGLNGVICSIDKTINTIEGDFTGFYGQVYIKDNRVVIAFRGTEPNTWQDWLTDFENKIGLIPPQYEDALNFAKQVSDKIDKANSELNMKYELLLTGHSLGGGLAAYVALTLGKPAVVFNAAGLGSGLLSAIGRDRLKHNSSSITNIHLDGDPMLWLDFWIHQTEQVGVLAHLSVPHDFLFYNSDGNNPIDIDQINRQLKQTEAEINRQIKQRELDLQEKYPGSTPPTIGIPLISVEGDSARKIKSFNDLLSGFNNQAKFKLDLPTTVNDHAGGGFNITLEPITLEPSVFDPESIYPHYMINVINALKVQAGIN